MRISACIITRDDKKIVDAVASVRPFVDEIVLVDTGSNDEGESVRAMVTGVPGDARIVPAIDTTCNDADGKIADFGSARALSFALATGDWILWLDSDDVVEGLENIRPILNRIDADRSPRIMCPYEYAYELGTGEVGILQMRERIVRNDGRYRWKYPVHEVLVSDKPRDDMECTTIVWKHRKDRFEEDRDPGRNLRILRRYEHDLRQARFRDEPYSGDAPPWWGRCDDAWLCINIGQELKAAGRWQEAVEYLTRYVELSQWTDQKAIAWLAISECYAAIAGFGDHTSARMAAEKAFELRSHWFEPSFALGKLDMMAGILRGDKQYLRRAIQHAQFAMSQPATKTPIATRPLERKRAHDLVITAHEMLDERGMAMGAAGRAKNETGGDPHFELVCREMDLEVFEDSQDVVIACIPTPEAWNPQAASRRGIGGSETAVIEVAKRLAYGGRKRVRVYCHTFNDGLWDGVEYRQFERLGEVGSCDVLIAWRDPSLLEHVRAAEKWLWIHDTLVFNPSSWYLHLPKRILTLSEWHGKRIGDNYRGGCPGIDDKIVRTRNGIDPARFEKDVVRNAHKAVYSSSPDRGLENLLEMWPAIRSRIPDAELHVFYGDKGLPEEDRERIAKKVAEAAPLGVFNRGRVDQQTLAQELLSAGVWLFPSWYSPRNTRWEETFCISACEAQAAGCALVCSSFGALAETAAGPLTTFVDYDPNDLDARIRFIRATLQAMRGGITEEKRMEHALYVRAEFDWDHVAAQWSAMMDGLEYESPDIADPEDGLPVIHMVLSAGASGWLLMDPMKPGGEAMGGGSRVGFLGLAQAMANLGRYHVRAFSTFSEHITRDGVEYVPIDKFAEFPQPSVLFAFYATHVLATAVPGVLRIASHHTYMPYGGVDNADVHTAPSQHTVDTLSKRYPGKGDWHLLPNGVPDVPVEVRDGAIVCEVPVSGRIIYHTSFDRGLHLLLQCYPEIKRRVPHASLHVVGPIARLIQGAHRHTGNTGERIRLCAEAWPAAMAAGDAVMLPPMKRAELVAELRQAELFAFPCSCTDPSETFSLSLMESAKMGIPIVLAPADALESIYAGSVVMTPAPAEEHLEEFTDAVVQMLLNPAARAEYRDRGMALAAKYTFDAQADALDAIIQKHLKPAEVAQAAE